jgi:hypothetical protein
MKSALTTLQAELDTLLDNYCFALESGRGIEAAIVDLEAEDYAEAIDVLKFSQTMEDKVTFGV